MDEIRRLYYSIPDAAKLKGITEEELFQEIREGKVKTKQIGMRMMIPAASVFNDLADQECTDRVEDYIEQLKPDLIKLLEKAPKYGSCGITVTFHDGRIHKVSTQTENTRLEDKKL